MANTNTSATGGPLVPILPLQPVDDDALDNVLQSLVVGITQIPGPFVRPRWQPVPQKQPEPNVSWCAIGIMSVEPDDGPWLAYDETNNDEINLDHESVTVLASFYGPLAQQNARFLRAGLNVPQNTEVLLPASIRYTSCGPVLTASELINQQWRRKYDLSLYFRRAVTLVYPIENLLSATVNLIDDTVVNKTIIVTDPLPTDATGNFVFGQSPFGPGSF